VDALSEQPRIVAEVREYADFLAALRTWIYELDTNYTCVNDLAGLQDGYLAKLLARSPSRNFGRTSLSNVLGALGLKLLLVVDAERLAKMRPRYERRKKHTSGAILAQKKTPLRGNSALAAMYAHRRALLQPPALRQQIARKAIRIRWERAKAAAPAL
jgi:hypothetical protein